ncbi:MAG: S8 family serine peptidase [Candidatus Hydrogenedens sp.]|nr:S8 family serine peptidase [Candidatus Hydrogenedens sp.]
MDTIRVAALLLCLAAGAAGAEPILLRTGAIDPAAASAKAGAPEGSVYVLAQFAELPSAGERWRLESEGIRFLRYVPEKAWWLRIEGGLDAQRHSALLKALTITLPGDSVDKIDPALRRKSGTAPEQLHVLFLPGAADAQALAHAGAAFLGWDQPNLARVRMAAGSADALNTVPGVEWVAAVPPPDKDDNVTSATRIGVDVVQAAPWNLDGSGVTIGLWESGGIADDHTDFEGRMTVIDLEVPVSEHATHVTGTLIGAGILQAPAKGMAPGATVRCRDTIDDLSEMLDDTLDGLVELSNHSYGTRVGWDYDNGWTDYGSDFFGQYSALSFFWDNAVMNSGLLIFKSAGNDRNDDPDGNGPILGDGPFDTIAHRGVAKNLITVGALDDLDGMSTFGSWGPADDGRVKPDISANGVGLFSTLPGDTYGIFSGTSMSTPSVCGMSAGLLQLFHQTYGPDPAPVQTMKAILIHSATDLGRLGPDYEFGWGIPQAPRAAQYIQQGLWREGVLTTGNTLSYLVDVPEDVPALKVTLVWLDPPASPSASKALINDLDLVLRGPGDATFQAFVLDKDNPTTPATTGRNNVDNVEQVVVDTPAAGTWTIEVNGYAVPQGPAPFSVVTEAFGGFLGVEGEGGTTGTEGEGTADGEGSAEGDGEGTNGGCAVSPITLNFCDDFNKVQSNGIFQQLDEELQPLVALLDPATADINGIYFVDINDLQQPIIQIQGNGLLDAGNELALIQAILADPCFDNGRVTHQQVRAAWLHNKNQLLNKQVGPLAPVLTSFIPGIANILIAYTVIGDGSVFTTGPGSASGQGSFGIVAGLFQILDAQLAGYFGSNFLDSSLDPADFMTIDALRPGKNADRDAFTNQQEYAAYPTRACPYTPDSNTDYVKAALNSQIYPGSPPIEGEGSVEGDGAADGEGITEGVQDGEGLLEEGEGDGDGVGSGDGEGAVSEGAADGEGGGEAPRIYSADSDGSFSLNLAELLRPIQFYNAGGYQCAAEGEGEDLYAAGPGDCSGCAGYDSDYAPADCHLSLSELLRVVQIFNLGGYYACESGEGGFCAGTPAP